MCHAVMGVWLDHVVWWNSTGDTARIALVSCIIRVFVPTLGHTATLHAPTTPSSIQPRTLTQDVRVAGDTRSYLTL